MLLSRLQPNVKVHTGGFGVLSCWPVGNIIQLYRSWVSIMSKVYNQLLPDLKKFFIIFCVDCGEVSERYSEQIHQVISMCNSKVFFCCIRISHCKKWSE